MTMRRRVLSIRISDAEYQALKAQACWRWLKTDHQRGFLLVQY